MPLRRVSSWAFVIQVCAPLSSETQRTWATTLRVVNDDQDVDFYYRLPGGEWRRMEESAEISGMQHNVLGGFLDVRPAVFAAGKGSATFRNFSYWPEVRVPA